MWRLESDVSSVVVLRWSVGRYKKTDVAIFVLLKAAPITYHETRLEPKFQLSGSYQDLATF